MPETPPSPETKPLPIFNAKAFRAWPVMALVAAMIAVHVWLAVSGTGTLNVIHQHYGAVPSRLWSGENLHSLLSHTLLHANGVHLAINAAAFFVLGAACWRVMGTARFLGFFTVTAIAGAAFFAVMRPAESSQLVGVSGVIFGLLAAFQRRQFYRQSLKGKDVRGQTALFIAVVLSIDFIIDLLPFDPLVGWGGSAVAWEAHVGGFVAGWLVTPLFMRVWPPRLPPPKPAA